MRLDDTIVAVSSASGPGARMVVRMSGARAAEFLQAITSAQSQSEAVKDNKSAAATARYLKISFAGVQCPVWVYQFFAPRSYTGQDLVELHIPGNPLLARWLMDDLVYRGARPAEAGEFTARAWFNGKLDLTQAQGVAATIAAGNRQQLLAARQLMAGELSRRLRPAMEMLAESLALVEAGIDFSDEGLDFLPAPEITRRIDSLISDLQSLLDQSARMENLAHEPVVVFAGRPSAGKSTLTNRLAGFARSIVSAAPGTTRDALSVDVALPHGTIRLMDIAGLDESEGLEAGESCEISRQMREQALRAIGESDLLVLVRDATDSRVPLALPHEADLTILSKADLLSESELPTGDKVLPVSAVTGFNLDALRAALDELAFGSAAGGASLALSARHRDALQQSIVALRRGHERIPAQSGEILPAELIAADLRQALDELGQILGTVSADDILGRIFSTFCIGK